MVETLQAILVVAMVVGVGVASLPWTDAELRSSARAFATVAGLPWLVLAGGRRRAVPSL